VILTSGNPNIIDKARDVCSEGPIVPKPYEHEALLQGLQRHLARRTRWMGDSVQAVGRYKKRFGSDQLLVRLYRTLRAKLDLSRFRRLDQRITFAIRCEHRFAGV